MFQSQRSTRMMNMQTGSGLVACVAPRHPLDCETTGAWPLRANRTHLENEKRKLLNFNREGQVEYRFFNEAQHRCGLLDADVAFAITATVLCALHSGIHGIDKSSKLQLFLLFPSH